MVIFRLVAVLGALGSNGNIHVFIRLCVKLQLSLRIQIRITPDTCICVTKS
jgi:hypothetical protein